MEMVYIFCLAVGAPLLLWFAFAGDAGADGPGADASDSGPFSVISLSSVAFVLAFFGLSGVIAVPPPRLQCWCSSSLWWSAWSPAR